MPERHASGVPGRCTVIDLGLIDPGALPEIAEITTGRRQNCTRAWPWPSTPSRATRTEKSGSAVADVEPLPLHADADGRRRLPMPMAGADPDTAARCGTLVPSRSPRDATCGHAGRIS